ncbi:Translation initiation factor eIF3 subunit 135 [Carpediemonas membranifera]|uniref:Translation initiation factor eIF3 subunit 135 n=1 Tax=Carpediemonas membranifera TaxID=201153 RepID=A0A8J6E513_9EUKA|nr:Translation initiation factor eIF3 subunit 135 [Carpediemonas membranifera]|eukprot:KAG9395182.1 Translation initiation factor eIF3 subunit 135 [Carpediemonas membranifera]
MGCGASSAEIQDVEQLDHQSNFAPEEVPSDEPIADEAADQTIQVKDAPIRTETAVPAASNTAKNAPSSPAKQEKNVKPSKKEKPQKTKPVKGKARAGKGRREPSVPSLPEPAMPEPEPEHTGPTLSLDMSVLEQLAEQAGAKASEFTLYVHSPNDVSALEVKIPSNMARLEKLGQIAVELFGPSDCILVSDDFEPINSDAAVTEAVESGVLRVLTTFMLWPEARHVPVIAGSPWVGRAVTVRDMEEGEARVEAARALRADFLAACEALVTSIPTLEPLSSRESGPVYAKDGIVCRDVSTWYAEAAAELRAHDALLTVPGVAPVPMAIVDVLPRRYLCTTVDPSPATMVCGSITKGAMIVTPDDAAAEVLTVVCDALDIAQAGKTDLFGNTALLPASNFAAYRTPHGLVLEGTASLLTPVGAGWARPELQATYGGSDATREGFVRYTSLEPTACDICGRLIEEYEYLKGSHGGNEFDVCTECHSAGKHRNVIPDAKLTRYKVPTSMREVYWKNEETGVVMATRPIELTPVQPESAESAADLQAAVEKAVADFLDDLLAAPKPYYTDAELIAAMHARGIPMSALGLIASNEVDLHAREMALRQMFGRTLRAFLRAQGELVDAETVAQTLNDLFTGLPGDVWAFIEDHSGSHYGFELTPEHRRPLFASALVHVSCGILGVTLDDSTVDYSADSPITAQAVTAPAARVKGDVVPAHFIARPLDAVDRALAVDEKGQNARWYVAGTEEREMATDILRKAAADPMATDEVALALADQLRSRHAESGRPEYSRWNRCANVPESDLSLEATALYDTVVQSTRARLHSTAPDYLSAAVTYALAMRGLAHLDEAGPSFLDRALGRLEPAVGFQHPLVAALYSELSVAYHEADNLDAALDAGRRAAVAAFYTLGPTHPMLQTVSRQFYTLETFAASGLDELSLTDAVARIEASVDEDEDSL